MDLSWLDSLKEQIANCCELDPSDVAALRMMLEATAGHKRTPRRNIDGDLAELQRMTLWALDTFAENGVGYHRWRDAVSRSSDHFPRLHHAELALMPLCNGRGEEFHFDLDQATEASRAVHALTLRWGDTKPGRKAGQRSTSKYQDLARLFHTAGYREPTFSAKALRTGHLKGVVES